MKQIDEIMAFAKEAGASGTADIELAQIVFDETLSDIKTVFCDYYALFFIYYPIIYSCTLQKYLLHAIFNSSILKTERYFCYA